MVKVKERPILFRSDMVQAVLSGSKTETRRIVKPVGATQPVHEESFGYKNCPYGGAGDRLWVKETWGITHQCDTPNNEDVVKYRAGGELWFKESNGIMALQGWANHWCPEPEKWTPSIYMPRWASRINLAILMIEIERIQMITTEGAIREGIDPRGLVIFSFMTLWNGINAKPRPVKSHGEITHYNSFPWAEEDRDPRAEINGKPHYCFPNPWVWVIKFKLITEEENDAA